MKDFATLLQAIASILWLIGTFVTLLLFRSQINDLVRRLKKGKLFGQEIELNESLDQLNRSAITAEQTVAALPQPHQEAPSQNLQDAVEEIHEAQSVLTEATARQSLP